MYFRVLYSLSGIPRTCKEPQLASLAGVEPATCRLGGGCSILLSYRDVGGNSITVDDGSANRWMQKALTISGLNPAEQL